MQETAKRLIDKFTSARFIMVVLFTVTYCGVVLGSLFLTCRKTIGVDTFLAIFSGFTTLAVMIVKSYFDRNDRTNNTTEGEQK